MPAQPRTPAVRACALALAIAMLAGCGLAFPPDRGMKVPTSCRKTPAIDLAISLVGYGAVAFVNVADDGGSDPDAKRGFTVLFGVTSTLFLGVAVLGFLDYRQC